MRREKYNLPDGNVTTDADLYIDTWRALGKPFMKFLGWTLFAYDPNLSFRTKDGRGVREVSVEVAQLVCFLSESRNEHASGLLPKAF